MTVITKSWLSVYEKNKSKVVHLGSLKPNVGLKGLVRQTKDSAGSIFFNVAFLF